MAWQDLNNGRAGENAEMKKFPRVPKPTQPSEPGRRLYCGAIRLQKHCHSCMLVLGGHLHASWDYLRFHVRYAISSCETAACEQECYATIS